MLLRRQGWRTLETRMDPYKTPLDQVLRQVIEAEALVSSQVDWIAEMERLCYDTKDDEVMLVLSPTLICISPPRFPRSASPAST
jgi:hypothetical protein